LHLHDRGCGDAKNMTTIKQKVTMSIEGFKTDSTIRNLVQCTKLVCRDKIDANDIHKLTKLQKATDLIFSSISLTQMIVTIYYVVSKSYFDGNCIIITNCRYKGVFTSIHKLDISLNILYKL
jgi:hypothetical protein